MKKIFLFAAVALASLTMNAKEWDFADYALDATGLAIGSKVLDGLTLYALDDSDPSKAFASGKEFGKIVEKAKTFDDAFKGQQCCKTGGGGNAEEATPWLPKQRYFSFAVNGNSTIKVWYESGSGDPITMYISDGTKVLSENAVSSADKDKAMIATANYEGAAGTIYIYGSKSIEVFKIEANAAQGINDVNAEVKAVKRFENGQLVIIKNGVKYNALGAVVE